MAEHLAHARAHLEQFHFAGPLITDDGTAPIGTMCIIELPDRAAAEEYVAGDGYAKAGMLETPTITRFVSSKRLKHADRADDVDLLGRVVGEDLNRSLLGQLREPLEELLALQRVRDAHATEHLGREVGDALEGDRLARRQSVTDAEGPGVVEPDDVAGVSFFEQCPVAR